MKSPDTEHRSLTPGTIITGPLFPEPVEILVVTPMGAAVQLVASGRRTGQAYKRLLTDEQIALLEVVAAAPTYTGDATRFKLGVEAMRLGLAHEYDPYFSLSVARVDPLPHQLEAVYEYFMRLPRIRFLLADDPGAGKTIMAGLLIKELKARGLIKRILILTPASLSFQWQRELRDRFREDFRLVNGALLRASYGSNPWQEHDQIVTSVSWASVIDDARESLLRSRWDLVIVDEAHKMSAPRADDPTLAYQLGEKLSEMTDHYLLMTATPHKGDPEHFARFLRLLDPDVYGDVTSLREAIAKRHAPFYLRRVKEALQTFPDPETGKAKLLFTRRDVSTLAFDLSEDEMEFYQALTQYVEDQSIRAAADDSARGRALGFTMAMLQRRFASSVYAVRRSLERMRDRRELILKDPAAYRSEQVARRLPENFDELPEDERRTIQEQLEGAVASVNPADLRDEIAMLGSLIDRARLLEQGEVETKLSALRAQLTERGIFSDPALKLLIFTEHTDTLDFLVGDGQAGRPLGKLRQWGLRTAQIHGGMKVGDAKTPGTRLHAEAEFKRADGAQILVATEAAGEGINLQFCWLMFNYDIPWSPTRLEQRMGRIHRYGQDRDCAIFNFVSVRTREGRVLAKLFERVEQIQNDLDPDHTGKVFNVLGTDIFPANELESLIRKMYARNLDEKQITDRIVAEVDTERIRRITQSTLESLVKRDINLAVVVGKTEEAKIRRLVPEVVEEFFRHAAPFCGLEMRELAARPHHFRTGKVPNTLLGIGNRQEPRHGALRREHETIVFDKAHLRPDPTLEWVTPGHPLFEAVRTDVQERTVDDIRAGAVFFDLSRSLPARLDLYRSSVKDGLGKPLHERLFIAECTLAGGIHVRPPETFLDLIAAPAGTSVPDSAGFPTREECELALNEHLLGFFLEEVRATRQAEVEVVQRHLKLSMEELIGRQNRRIAALHAEAITSENPNLVQANIASANARLDELMHRYTGRKRELEAELQVSVADTDYLGSAWALPHPERATTAMAAMVRDEEIERIAVAEAMRYERERGWEPESVEAENLGFDLKSRRRSPDDPSVILETRFIEVKGRAGIGDVALSPNEYNAAVRLKDDYWLYRVFNCAGEPRLEAIQNPARLDWQQVVKVERYVLGFHGTLDAVV